MIGGWYRSPLTPNPSPAGGEGGSFDCPTVPLLPSWEKVDRLKGETDEGGAEGV